MKYYLLFQASHPNGIVGLFSTIELAKEAAQSRDDWSKLTKWQDHVNMKLSAWIFSMCYYYIREIELDTVSESLIT